MLKKGIPAKDLFFRVIKASAPNELQPIIDSLLGNAAAQSLNTS